jgi:hypothetical protein
MAKTRDPQPPEAPVADTAAPDPQPPEAPVAAPAVPPVAAAPRRVQLVLMPEANGRTDAAATDLLLEACDKFGVHPGADQRPRELLSWRYYPAQPLEDVPAAVVLVTAGGVKLKHFAGNAAVDLETEERLRAIFKSFAVDKVTKQMVPQPLPADLTLPGEAVTGHPNTTRHRHEGGYLRRAQA